MTLEEFAKPQAFDTILTPEEAAEVLRISPSTLKRWRLEGTGPKYLQIGRVVRYPQARLLEFMERVQR